MPPSPTFANQVKCFLSLTCPRHKVRRQLPERRPQPPEHRLDLDLPQQGENRHLVPAVLGRKVRERRRAQVFTAFSRPSGFHVPLCSVVDALLDVDTAALGGFHDERGDVGAEVQDESVQAGA